MHLIKDDSKGYFYSSAYLLLPTKFNGLKFLRSCGHLERVGCWPRRCLLGDRRRSFSCEFKLEAVRLVTAGGLSLAQAARDLGVQESVLGRWKKQQAEDPEEAFPGKSRLKDRDEELRRLSCENDILRQERDVLKKPWASSRGCPNEMPVCW
ncbi:MAG: transposase [Pseudomonadota bacterium]